MESERGCNQSNLSSKNFWAKLENFLSIEIEFKDFSQNIWQFQKFTRIFVPTKFKILLKCYQERWRE